MTATAVTNPTPAPGPATESTTPAAEPSSGGSSFSDDDVKSLIASDDVDEPLDRLEPEPTPVLESAPESKPAVVQPKSGPTPTPEATPAPTPTPAPAATKVEPTPTPTPSDPTVESTPQPQPTAKEQEAQWKAFREQAETKLMQTYQLSKEDADAMAVNPETVFPKMAARIHMNAMDEALGAMSRALPQMMRTVMAGINREAELEGQFFNKFPALKGHRDVAVRYIVGVGQANPGQPMETLMDQAGLAAMIHLKLPLDGLPGYTPPAVPTATPPNEPFTPAPPGGGNTPTAKPAPNAFTQLAQEFLADDSTG